MEKQLYKLRTQVAMKALSAIITARPHMTPEVAVFSAFSYADEFIKQMREK